MIMSVHIADVGPRRAAGLLRRPLDGSDSPGLRHAEATVTAPLASGLPPVPKPGRVALVACWDDDAAIDRFLDSHPVAEALAGGWHVRLEPLRAVGAYAPFDGLPTRELPVDDEEPVVVLTYGRLKLRRAVAFFRANSPASGLVNQQPAMLAGTGLARPPRIVSTFSVWRTAREMREYALGQAGPGHRDAARQHNANPFHHESVFARFRPYGAEGLWDGRQPLEGVAVPAGV
jgi:hypothetical protein